MITIREPFWKHRAFGIADRELVGDEIEVQCSYKAKDGKKLYPHTYKIRCGKAKMYPAKLQKGTLLHIIPVEAFEIKDEKEALS